MAIVSPSPACAPINSRTHVVRVSSEAAKFMAKVLPSSTLRVWATIMREWPLGLFVGGSSVSKQGDGESRRVLVE